MCRCSRHSFFLGCDFRFHDGAPVSQWEPYPGATRGGFVKTMKRDYIPVMPKPDAIMTQRKSRLNEISVAM
ncbi:hypothetical protein D7S89_08455 [Trinickia fusca]|uniref:Uncharacterized protein n=1 Tax=Trinickia fusca TaxID=2419777 RepID=A0A494XK15_9BURK|nr:hypothetical protein D7S89_08455 [Trinickia fusca]